MSKVQYKCTIQTSVRCRAETKLHYTEKVIFKKQSSGGGESSDSGLAGLWEDVCPGAKSDACLSGRHPGESQLDRGCEGSAG